MTLGFLQLQLQNYVYFMIWHHVKLTFQRQQSSILLSYRYFYSKIAKAIKSDSTCKDDLLISNTELLF